MEYYDKSLEINSNNAIDWTGKGWTLYNLGEYKEAIECYDKALEIDSKFVLAWNNKAGALNKLGK